MNDDCDIIIPLARAMVIDHLREQALKPARREGGLTVTPPQGLDGPLGKHGMRLWNSIQADYAVTDPAGSIPQHGERAATSLRPSSPPPRRLRARPKEVNAELKPFRINVSPAI